MHKALWSSALACTLLAGCATIHPRTERTAKLQTCDSASACVIAVDVACERFFGCELSVDYDLVLANDRGKATNIIWRLSGETGARFPADGIVVDSSEFNCSGGPAESREFKCIDTHADFGVFKYRINVTVPDSAFGPRGVPSLDPWIVNR